MPQPSYPALRAYVAADPLGRGFASKTDAEVAADLNDASVVTVTATSIPLTQVAAWAAPAVRANIEAACGNATSPVHSICLTVRDWLQSLNGPPLLLNEANLAMIDALVSAGVMQGSDKTALLALSQSTTSQALSLPGWGVPVTSLDVAAARAS